jgi:hypothetical protein
LGHIAHTSQKEDATILILPMILIECGEEAATRDSLGQSLRQEFGEQVQQAAVADHPFRLLIKLIQFPVFLQLNQMVDIWSNHDTLSQFVQQLLLGCSNQFCIQNPDFPHSNAKVVIFPQTTK